MSLCYNGFVRVIFVKDTLIQNYIEGFVLDSKYASECRGHELLVTMDMPAFLWNEFML